MTFRESPPGHRSSPHCACNPDVLVRCFYCFGIAEAKVDCAACDGTGLLLTNDRLADAVFFVHYDRKTGKRLDQ